jgi:alpha-beta hydrolase superfamily lysophospholipase
VQRWQETNPDQYPQDVGERDGGRALYFAHSDRPLFGWLHLPEATDSRNVGLLICNPFGNEAICAHRTIRHIAEHACRAGMPVLRFDYDGTGDSAGQDGDPDRVQAWLASVAAAADELRCSAGVERLCLLGIRLGAALAATVAAGRDDVTALIGIAPVVAGKAYVRELRLLERAMAAKRNISPEKLTDTLEAAGFVLTAPTQAALSALDLKQLEKPPAPDILILERAEMPGDGGWGRHLQAGGAQVTHKVVPGYTEMMLDSHESVIPEEMLTAIFDWLGVLLARENPATAPPTDAGREPGRVVKPSSTRTGRSHIPAAALPGEALSERTVRFGRSNSLVGIVSSPLAHTGVAPVGDAKAIILVNSGAVHRVGPNRLYVTLARHFARRGHVVLRMDISGLGDSAPRPDAAENVVYSKHAVGDLREALDYLQREWSITNIYAMGLCSGAYNVFKAAVAELPLAGITLINPLIFFWKEGMSLKYPEHRVADDIVRYRTNAFRLAAWLKLLRGGVNLWELSHVMARRAHTVALTHIRAAARLLNIRLGDDLPTEIRAIARRGIRLQFVFAERDPGVELLRILGGATVRKLSTSGALGIQAIEGADHTFTTHAMRAALLSALDRSLG